MLWSQNNEQLLVHHGDGLGPFCEFTIIDTTTGYIFGEKLEMHCFLLEWVLDSNAISFISVEGERADVWIFDLTNGELKNLTGQIMTFGVNNYHWLSRSEILVIGPPLDSMYYVNIEQPEAATHLVTKPCGIARFDVNLSRRWVIFGFNTRCVDGGDESPWMLSIYEIDTQNQYELVDNAGIPRISPNEQFLAFVKLGQFPLDLWIYDFETQEFFNLTEGRMQTSLLPFDWSLDSRFIVFSRHPVSEINFTKLGVINIETRLFRYFFNQSIPE